jgi:hypothetical protein
LVFILLGGTGAGIAQSSAPGTSDAMRDGIRLISPYSNYRFSTRHLAFQWQLADSSGFQPITYEIRVQSRFRQTTFDTTLRATGSAMERLTLTNARKHFKKHGRYVWQVRAVNADHEVMKSVTREFYIPPPATYQNRRLQQYPFALKWVSTRRLQRADFDQLLDSAYPKTHLQGHSDLCLVFSHYLRFGFELEEQVSLNTQVGLGGGINARWRLYENVVIGFYPSLSAGICWFGTGLQRYSSRQSHATMGLDVVINPKGYLSCNARWIPAYRLHYAEKADGFRVFEGEGWEWGAKITIPKTILTPFTMLGLQIDFERMPIEYTYSRIKDDYTGVIMPTQCIGVSFLFN